MTHDTPAVRFDRFSYSYDDGTSALREISLSIAFGESVGIIGHNGSGKTTLLMHVVGILIPRGGVAVAGIPVTAGNLNDIRLRVGYVFQDTRDQLFMPTVIEDVAFGPLNLGLPRAEALDRSGHALEAVGLAGYGGRIPYHLSGGEMRRVAIATVLAVSPDILVMDEPSSGLDPRAKRELAPVIRSLPCTKIIASHDLDFVASCTERIILLHKGEVAADGSTGDILTDRRLLEENGL